MKKHILVVDDDQLILYALAKALKDDAYEVRTAATATAAINHLSACPYDLCLLDLHLPDLSGLELMQIIKDVCPRTKIVIMTAYCLDYPELNPDINEAVARGACHFVAKPFDLCDLTRVVDKVLTNGKDDEPGIHFTDSTAKKRKRNNPRKPYHTDIRFHLNVIDQGESKRWTITAKTLDISDGGIGLATTYPLKASQVIGFGEDMDNRIGVVAWSSMVDHQTCRAGIKFA